MWLQMLLKKLRTHWLRIWLHKHCETLDAGLRNGDYSEDIDYALKAQM